MSPFGYSPAAAAIPVLEQVLESETEDEDLQHFG